MSAIQAGEVLKPGHLNPSFWGEGVLLRIYYLTRGDCQYYRYLQIKNTVGTKFSFANSPCTDIERFIFTERSQFSCANCNSSMCKQMIGNCSTCKQMIGNSSTCKQMIRNSSMCKRVIGNSSMCKRMIARAKRMIGSNNTNINVRMPIEWFYAKQLTIRFSYPNSSFI